MESSGCISNEKFSGEPIGEESRVSFVELHSDRLECYDLQELYEIFFKQEKLYYWNPVEEEAVESKRIFKLSYTGKWIDQATYDLIFLAGYDAIALYPKEKVPIGSEYTVSSTHGSMETIYTGIPVRSSDLKGEHLKTLRGILLEILPETKKNAGFVPLPVEIFEAPASPPPIPDSEDEEDEEKEQESADESEQESEEDHGWDFESRKEEVLDGKVVRITSDETSEIKKLNDVLDDFTLEQIHSIEKIEIKNVKILDANLDPLVWKALKEISLINCHLTSINVTDFPQLTSLNLSYNLMRNVPVLKNLPKLSELNLKSNLIASLKALEGTNLPSLKVINVEYNFIAEIGEEVDHFPSLEKIIITNENQRNSTVGFEKNVERLPSGIKEVSLIKY